MANANTAKINIRTFRNHRSDLFAVRPKSAPGGFGASDTPMSFSTWFVASMQLSPGSWYRPQIPQYAMASPSSKIGCTEELPT
jgi:hypothetical protein